MTHAVDDELGRLGELTDGWIREAIARHISSRAERLAAMLEYHLGWRGVELQRLAEGQFLDIDLQQGDTPVTLEAYEAMIARKTGVLFACACRMGAMAAGASAEATEAFAAYGLELGLAFQEQDDLLGVWGRSAETGKPDAADVVERKRGLPAAIALSLADAPAWLTAAYAERDGSMPTDMVERVMAHFEALDL